MSWEVMMLDRLTVLLLILGSCAGHNELQRQDSMLSVEEARRLVYEALPDSTKRLPGLTLWLSDEDKAKPSKCLTFDVLWDNRGPGSVHVGFWSVDMRAGEVWTPMLCERVTSGSLRKLQVSLRKKLGVSMSECEESLRHNPCCTPEPMSKPDKQD